MLHCSNTRLNSQYFFRQKYSILSCNDFPQLQRNESKNSNTLRIYYLTSFDHATVISLLLFHFTFEQRYAAGTVEGSALSSI
jgi:hypothetical protein